MINACLGLLAGIYALQLSSFADLSDYLGVVFVAACLLLLFRQLIAAACLVVGATLFLVSAEHLVASRIPANIEGDSIVVTARVLDFPKRTEESVSFLAHPIGDPRLPDRIRLSWFQPPVAVHHGDNWQLEVRLRRPRGNRNPGGFDLEGWLFREQIAAVGYVVEGHRNHLLRATGLSPVQRLRMRVVQRISLLIDEPESAAVLMAVVVGARHQITREQWQRYAATGSSHLMAISGLHIGLCALGAYYLARSISGLCGGRSGSRNHHQLAIACSLLVALLYAMVSGFAIPARRASLMLVLGGIYLLDRRHTDAPRAVAMAALLLAAANPLVSMAPGFVLSFGAVVILLWSFRCQRRGLPTLQVSLLLGLMPLTAHLFDRISFAALPVNLVAVPLFSLVTVPLALVGVLCDGPLMAIGDWTLLAAAYSVMLLEKLLHLFAMTEWASIEIPDMSGFAAAYLCVPAIWALLPAGWPGRSLAWLGIIGICLYRPEPPATACVEVSVLDVGQGLAVVIQTNRHTVLYDTGPAYRSGGTAANSVILPFLRSQGIQRIDQLLVSHADLDHAGGVTAIAAAMPVRRALAGEALAGMPAEQCRSGQAWTYDGIKFSVLHPRAGTQLDGNDRSCVLLVEAGEFRMLLTGDIERAAELELVRTGGLPAVQVATVPHHGSRTSSTQPFVTALAAEFALVSAAFGNHWGLPKNDVLQRWRASGARVMNTADSGAIELQACADSGLRSIRRYRVVNHRIWHE